MRPFPLNIACAILRALLDAADGAAATIEATRSLRR